MVSRILAAAAAFLFLAPTAAHAAEPWQQSWASVKADSAQKCAKVLDTYQLQAVCMDNEKKGYDKMQGDFGLPLDVASNAKAKCAQVFDTFQMQAVCMDNEKKGYDQMKKY
jgi:hypothetical protein